MTSGRYRENPAQVTALSYGMYRDLVREVLSNERARQNADGVAVIDRVAARLKLSLEARTEVDE